MLVVGYSKISALVVTTSMATLRLVFVAITFVTPVLIASVCYVFLLESKPKMGKDLLKWKNAQKTFVYHDHTITYADVDGYGEEHTLVLLHGFPTSSYDWHKVMPRLITRFKHIVAPDFLGFGFSDKPEEHNYSISEQADIVESLLQALGTRDVHILAHDYGDTVAQELVDRVTRTDEEISKDHLRIHSLVMLNGGIYPEMYRPRFIQKLMITPVVGNIAARMVFFMVFKKSLSDVFGERKPTYQEAVDYWAVLKHANGHRRASSLLQYIPERAVHGERWVQAINRYSPVHIIYGPADPVNPPPVIEYARYKTPGVTWTVLDKRVGHYPQLEDPKSTMDAYLTFLDQWKDGRRT